MTTPGAALGRTASGGGETQTATPRILAAVTTQRQSKESGWENEEAAGTTSTNWQPGRRIEPGEVRRVHQEFSPQQRYARGDIVAMIHKRTTAAPTSTPRWLQGEQVQYNFAAVVMDCGLLGNLGDPTCQVLVYHGAMQPMTWESFTGLRALCWDSRTPGDELGSQDQKLLRSHRRLQTMHFEGDLVGVAGRRKDGRQVLRYAKVCEKRDSANSDSPGLYQLDEGPLMPVSFRCGWEFFGMGRSSPTRDGVPASEIVEVPSVGTRQGPPTQAQHWTQRSWRQGGLEPEMEPQEREETDELLELTDRADQVRSLRQQTNGVNPRYQHLSPCRQPPPRAPGKRNPRGRLVVFGATNDPGQPEIERWQPGRWIADEDYCRILPCSETKVFRVGDRVAIAEHGGTLLRPCTLMRYYVAHVRETNMWQVGWEHNTCYLRLDEGAGHEVIRKAAVVQEIVPPKGTARGTDSTPEELCTAYTGRTQAAATWSEPTTTDI